MNVTQAVKVWSPERCRAPHPISPNFSCQQPLGHTGDHAIYLFGSGDITWPEEVAGRIVSEGKKPLPEL